MSEVYNILKFTDVSSVQVWCTLLPVSSCHWLSEEHHGLLPENPGRLCVRQTATHLLSCCIHSQLLHGHSVDYGFHLFPARGLCYAGDDTLQGMRSFQVKTTGSYEQSGLIREARAIG